MPTKIIKCGCKTGIASKQQDEMYGKDMRVGNLEKGDYPKAVCTCCGKKEV